MPALFGRACALYLHNARLYLTLAGIMFAPFFAARLVGNAAFGPTPALPPAHPPVGYDAYLALVAVLGLIVAPIGEAATIFAAAELQAGRKPAVLAALRYAVGRWLPNILLNLLWIGGSLVAALAVGAIAFASTLLLRADPQGPLMTFTLGALALAGGTAAVVLVPTLLFLTYGCSKAAIVLETTDPRRAIALAFARTWTRTFFRRAFAVGCALGALAWLPALAAILFFAQPHRSPIPTLAFDSGLSLLGLALFPLLMTLPTLYALAARDT